MLGCVLMRDTGLVKGEVLVLAHIISCLLTAVCVNSDPAGADLESSPLLQAPPKAPGQELALLGLFQHEGIILTG